MAIIHYSVGYYFKTALTQLAPKFNFFICHYSTFDFNRTRRVFYNGRKKMRCYLSNGIKARQFKEDDFSVTKWVSSDGMESYSFTGDEIFYEIDDLCVNLYDRLAEAIFDLEEYPQFIKNDTVHESFIPVTREGTPIQEAFKDAREMTSFLTITKLIYTLFEEFLNWMLG